MMPSYNLIIESSIIMNPNNMYMICIKDLILNK